MTTIATPCIVEEVATRLIDYDVGPGLEYTITLSTQRAHANPIYMQLTISTQDADVAKHLTPGAHVRLEVVPL